MDVYQFTNEASDYSFTITIDGVDFRLRNRWNERSQAWYMDLLTAEDVSIAIGQKVSLNGTLFERIASADKYEGILFVLSTGENSELSFDNLPTSAELIYMTVAEAAAALASSATIKTFVMT